MLPLVEFYHDVAVDFGLGRPADDDCLLGHDDGRRLRLRLVLHKYFFGGTVRALDDFGRTDGLLRTLPGDHFLTLERQVDRIAIEFLQIEDLVGMRPQQFLNPQTAQPLPLVRVAHPRHNISQQRRVSPEPLPLHSKLQMVPSPHPLAQLPQINRIIFNIVQLLSIEQRSRLQQGDPNRKRLGQYFISIIVVVPLSDKFEFLGREVGESLRECSFLKIGVLIRPTVQIGNFDLPLLIDKDVVRPHIPNFTINPAKIPRTAHQRIQQVPQLLLLKMFIHLNSVLNLLLE